MIVLFPASDEPIASRLEHRRQVVDETFGPALLHPPSRTHVPQQLVAGDVGAVRVSELRIAYPTPSSCRLRRPAAGVPQDDGQGVQPRIGGRARIVNRRTPAANDTRAGPGKTGVDASDPTGGATMTTTRPDMRDRRFVLGPPGTMPADLDDGKNA